MVGFVFDYVSGVVYNGRSCYVFSCSDCDKCVLLKGLGCKYSRIKKASCWTRIW